MKKTLALMGAIVTACMLLLPAATPAQAGWQTWTTTNCTTYNGWPDPRLDVQWYQQDANTIFYYSSKYNTYWGVQNYDTGGYGYWNALGFYGAGGYQCNTPGVPMGYAQQCPGYPIPFIIRDQDFEGGRIFMTLGGQMHYAYGNHTMCQLV